MPLQLANNRSMFSGAVTRYLRSLHNRADCTLVPTAEMRASLEALAFERVAVVGRGVDTQLFNPARRSGRLRAAWGCSGSIRNAALRCATALSRFRIRSA